jgi:Tol biopolymer transport system component
VLGTAGYLSPGQARGRHVDKRSDVFSFGCVLYEMLTGKTIFPGETVTDSLGATLHREPDWSSLPADTPPTIALLLRRCLAKDRRRRLHDIADARVEIEDAITDPTSSSLGLASAAIAAPSERGRRSTHTRIVVAFVAGVVATAAFAWGIWGRSSAPATPPHLNRLGISVPHPPPRFGQLLAAAPDGRTVVVNGENDDGEAQLFLRRLEQRTLTPLVPTSDFVDFTLSPDGNWVAYRDRGALRRVAIDGGPPTRLARVGFGVGMHWCDDGWIYIGSGADVVRVPENGGDPETLASIEDADDVDPIVLAPRMLHESNTLLYTAFNPIAEERMAITAVALADGTERVLLDDAVQGIDTPTGHLLFLRDETLMAASLDTRTAQITSPPVPVAEGIWTMSFVKLGNFSLASDGTLFSARGRDIAISEGVFVVDRAGARTPLASFSSQRIMEITFAPDGRRLAVGSISMVDTFEAAIWIIDVEKNIPSLLTADDGNEFEAVWSPDGSWIYYVSRGSEHGAPCVLRTRVDTTGAAELVHQPTQGWSLFGMLRDRTTLLAGYRDGVDGSMDIVTLATGDESTETPWLATSANENDAAISPNGQWIAYASDETGRRELYVRSAAGERRQRISSNGLEEGPFWATDGSAIYFTEQAGDVESVMAVTITGGHAGIGDDAGADGPDGAGDANTILTWEPAQVFVELLDQERLLGVHPEGQMVIAAPTTDADRLSSYEIEVTQNFLAEVEKRAPIDGRR